jgi:transposase
MTVPGGGCRLAGRRTRPSGAGSWAGGVGRCWTGHCAFWSHAAGLRLVGNVGRQWRSSIPRASRPARSAARPHGYDANKKLKGGKRVLMIDTRGDPLRVRMVSGNVQDRDALRALAPDLAVHGSLLLVWQDRAFASDDPAIFLRRYGVAAELVGTCSRQRFQVEPRRWMIEQTFGCLQRYRRLCVDDETSDDTSRQMTLLASVFMTGMRPERMLQT